MVKIQDLVAPLCIKTEDGQCEGADYKQIWEPASKISTNIEADSPESKFLLNLVRSIDQKCNFDVSCGDGSTERKPSMHCSKHRFDTSSAVCHETAILVAPFPLNRKMKVEKGDVEEFEEFPNLTSSPAGRNNSYESAESKSSSEVVCNTHNVPMCIKREFESAPLVKLVKVEENATKSDELPHNNVCSNHELLSNFLEESSDTKRPRLSSSDTRPCRVVLEHINKNTASCNVSYNYTTNNSLKTLDKSSNSLVQDGMPFEGTTRDCMTLGNSNYNNEVPSTSTNDSLVRKRNKIHGKTVACDPETLVCVNQDKLTHKSEICTRKLKGKKTQNSKLFTKKIHDSTPNGNVTLDDSLIVETLDNMCTDSKTHIMLKYQCETCKWRFARKEYVQRHILYHCGGPPSSAKHLGSSQECAQSYFNFGLRRTDGVEEKRPQCKDCGKYYSRLDVLQKHIRRAHMQPKVQKKVNLNAGGNSGRSLTCDHCQKTYLSKSRLQLHLSYYRKRSESQLKRVCSACDAFFPDSYSFNRHMRWAHRRVNVSSRHVDEASSTRERQCEGCGNVFTRRFDLKKRLRRPGIRNSKFNALVAVPKTDLTICKFCEKVFSSEGFLTCHLLRRYKQPAQVCQLCCAYFEDPKKLYEHYPLIHRTSFAKIKDSLPLVDKKLKNSAGSSHGITSGQNISKSRSLIDKKSKDPALVHEISPKQARKKRSPIHKKFKNPVYFCDYCGKSFRKKGWLLNHIHRLCSFEN